MKEAAVRADPPPSRTRAADTPIVAVASGKGGVGKTVVTLGLCAHTALAHGKALAADIDPEAVTYDLTQTIADPGYDVVHEQDPEALAQIGALRNYDIIIVDCPGSLEGRDMLDTLLRRTDYVIIPYDHDPTSRNPTLRTAAYAAERGVPYRVLLNNIDPRLGADFVRGAWEWLEKQRLPYFRTLVRRYRAWPTSLDQGVPITRYRGKHAADARADIGAVHTELLLELGRRRMGR